MLVFTKKQQQQQNKNKKHLLMIKELKDDFRGAFSWTFQWVLILTKTTTCWLQNWWTIFVTFWLSVPVILDSHQNHLLLITERFSWHFGWVFQWVLRLTNYHVLIRELKDDFRDSLVFQWVWRLTNYNVLIRELRDDFRDILFSIPVSLETHQLQRVD